MSTHSIIKEARSLIQKFLSEREPTFNQSLLLIGKLDLIFELMEKQNTLQESPKREYRKKPKDDYMDNKRLRVDNCVGGRGSEDKP